MGKFSDGVIGAINKHTSFVHKTFANTMASMSEAIVAQTPVKSGAAISAWRFTWGQPSGGAQIINFFNPATPATTQFSHSVSPALALQLKNNILASFKVVSIVGDTSYFLFNEVSNENGLAYILLLENGGYRNIPEHERDPYPPYYPTSVFGKKFTLLTGPAISKKAPRGLMKLNLMDAKRIFTDSMTKD